MTNQPDESSSTGKLIRSEVRSDQIENLVELAERVSSDVMEAETDITDAYMYLKYLREALEELR